MRDNHQEATVNETTRRALAAVLFAVAVVLGVLGAFDTPAQRVLVTLTVVLIAAGLAVQAWP